MSRSLLNFLLLLQEKKASIRNLRRARSLYFYRKFQPYFLVLYGLKFGIFFAFNGFLIIMVFSSKLPPMYWIHIDFFYCNYFFPVDLFIYCLGLCQMIILSLSWLPVQVSFVSRSIILLWRILSFLHSFFFLLCSSSSLL